MCSPRLILFTLNSCSEGIAVFVYPRCVMIYDSDLHSSSLSGRQAVLPPSQPPHARHQVSTCPSLLSSLSSSLPPSPPYGNVSALQVHACIFMTSSHSPPLRHPLFNDSTNSNTARTDSPQTSFPSTLDSQPGMSCCRPILTRFSAGWIRKVFMSGGLHENALKGLRRDSYCEH